MILKNIKSLIKINKQIIMKLASFFSLKNNNASI